MKKSTVSLPADVKQLQRLANQRIGLLKRTYKRTHRQDVKQALDYLQHEAGTYKRRAGKFTFKKARGTKKTLDYQIDLYRKKLEYVLQTKTRVSDINESERKRRLSFEKNLGGLKLTKAQYDKLGKIAEEQGDTVYYNLIVASEQINNNDWQVKNGVSDKKIVDEILKLSESGTPIIDIPDVSTIIEEV